MSHTEPVHTPEAPSAIAAAIWRPDAMPPAASTGVGATAHHGGDVTGVAPGFVAGEDPRGRRRRYRSFAFQHRKPARQVRSAWTEAWDGPDSPGPLSMPLQSVLVAEAQRRISRAAGSHAGAPELATYYVGQVVGMADRVRPAAGDEDMVNEYLEVVTGLATMEEQ